MVPETRRLPGRGTPAMVAAGVAGCVLLLTLQAGAGAPVAALLAGAAVLFVLPMPGSGGSVAALSLARFQVRHCPAAGPDRPGRGLAAGLAEGGKARVLRRSDGE